MFIRSSAQSIVRVDLGYVVDGASRTTQHDLVFRIGIGS
jgi:hypothetical protein